MLIFFYYLDFEMIEFDIFYETVFSESCFGMSFEILDILIEPYGLGQIESKAYFLQWIKDLVSAGVLGVILYGDVPQHVIVFEFLRP